MNEYRIDVKMYGTLYIHAASAEDALKIAKSTKYDSVDVLGEENMDHELGFYSFSAVATCYGPEDGAVPELVDE